MPRPFNLVRALELDELAAYHQDAVSSLRLYFSPLAPTFVARFAGETPEDVEGQLRTRLDESDVRSSFAVLTSLEANFRIDFDFRCRKRLKDNLSVYFRSVERERGDKVRLDEDILEGWKLHTTGSAALIGELRGAFRFRDWLAHGRYWMPKLERKYDFNYLHLLADGILSQFNLES